MYCQNWKKCIGKLKNVAKQTSNQSASNASMFSDFLLACGDPKFKIQFEVWRKKSSIVVLVSGCILNSNDHIYLICPDNLRFFIYSSFIMNSDGLALG